MVNELILKNGLIVPASDLSWRFSRAGGPGGQSVNKIDSRVELIFNFTGSSIFTPFQKSLLKNSLVHRLVDGRLSVVVSDHRSQWQNRQLALKRMAELLFQALDSPSTPRRPTRPTRGSVKRRLENKKKRSLKKKLRRDQKPLES